MMPDQSLGGPKASIYLRCVKINKTKSSMNSLSHLGFGMMVSGLMAFSTTARAQETVRFGLHVLPSLSWFSSNIDDLDADSRFNFSFGLMADVHFSEQYALTTGLNIVKRGGSMVLLDGTLATPKNVQGDYTMSLIEFPLALKMRLVDAGDIVPFAKFGGAFGIKTNEKTTFSYAYPDATVPGDRFHNVTAAI